MLHDKILLNSLSAKTFIDGNFRSRRYREEIQNISDQTLCPAHIWIAQITVLNNSRAGTASDSPIAIPCHGYHIDNTHITIDALVRGVISFYYLLTLVIDRSISFVRFRCYMYLLLLESHVVTCSSYSTKR